jgi:hypothetical protein
MQQPYLGLGKGLTSRLFYVIVVLEHRMQGMSCLAPYAARSVITFAYQALKQG